MPASRRVRARSPASAATSPVPRARNARTEKLIIAGAAGRDFHNFNLVYRDDPATEVIAFTATQIPGIASRRYPATLAGPRYPEGIPIVDESRLESLIRKTGATRVEFAYSDVAHEAVMHLASRALASGADFSLLGPRRTQLQATRPVIAVSAVRTGCGKSQVARHVSRIARARGLKVAVLRHPMPYGDLAMQRVQRLATRADLLRARCTVEEREEYEPHIAAGNVVYAGVDYAAILRLAESEADLILWDGGNNDFPFLRPNLHIVLTDALRPGHESRFHPGEAVLRMADIVVVAKADAATTESVRLSLAAARDLNAGAVVIRGASPVTLDQPDAVHARRILVVEDGPTLTHGGMPHGAGFLAAERAGACEIVDPRPHAAPEIAAVYRRYPHIGPVLPAMGYSPRQVAALRATISACPADVVVSGTPIDLARLLGKGKQTIGAKPVVRARYEFADLDSPGLGDHVSRFLDSLGARAFLRHDT